MAQMKIFCLFTKTAEHCGLNYFSFKSKTVDPEAWYMLLLLVGTSHSVLVSHRLHSLPMYLTCGNGSGWGLNENCFIFF